jgi:hypothetical protein
MIPDTAKPGDFVNAEGRLGCIVQVTTRFVHYKTGVDGPFFRCARSKARMATREERDYLAGVTDVVLPPRNRSRTLRSPEKRRRRCNG